MTACQELEVLLSLRAAGALAPDEAERVEAHLAGCAACRAEADADREVLRLAALGPPSAAEERATANLAREALDTLRLREARAASWKRAIAGFAAAAALALVVVAPAVLGKKPVLPPAPAAADATASADTATWQAPDLDTLWTEADVLDVSGTSASASDTTDTSYLALDSDL